MASNYREIPALLRAREPFEGNSMSAAYERYAMGGMAYVVRSYGTEIASLLPDGQKVINDTKYSHTTSRHQNLVRENL
jgi:hypothetical protein